MNELDTYCVRFKRFFLATRCRLEVSASSERTQTTLEPQQSRALGSTTDDKLVPVKFQLYVKNGIIQQIDKVR